jgi:hypothetical protein
MVAPDPDPHNPWWRRTLAAVLAAVLRLIESPGWEGTLKVAVLAVVFAGIYVGIYVALHLVT